MRTLVKINYAIAIFVIFLGFVASYVSSQRHAARPSQISEDTAPPKPIIAEPEIAQMGDWRYECALSIDGLQDCKARQKIAEQDDAGTLALEIVLSMNRSEAHNGPRIKLIAPLGSFLPAGFLMKIDAREPFIIPFQSCTTEGCFVNLDLAPDVVEALRGEGSLLVEYMNAGQEVISIPVNLRGVGGVLDRLAKEGVKP